jgi:3-oxoacyl-[acyl-carrier protein] reductase
MKAQLRLEARVLVTGGTRGLGEGIARAFARAGARVAVTHRWGSVPAFVLARRWEEEGLPPPLVVEADAGEPDDTRALMDSLGEHMGGLDIIVANVAFGGILRSLSAFDRGSAELSLRRTTWPLFDLVLACQERLERLPERVVAVSSLGASRCPDGYDYIGIAKAALEASCRYLAARLGPAGVRVNALRYGYVDTDGLAETFGPDEVARLREAGAFLALDEAAEAAVALGSGWLDAVNGHVLVVDGGASLRAPFGDGR